MSEEPDNKEPKPENKVWNYIKNNKSNIFNVVVVTMAVVLWADIYIHFRPNYGATAKGTGRPKDAIKKYYSAMGLGTRCVKLDDLIAKIGLNDFQTLLEDKDIIARTDANKESWHRNGLFYEFNLERVLGLEDKRHMGHNKGHTLYGLIWDDKIMSNINEYVALTSEERKIGFFTIFEGRYCGLTIDDLSKMGELDANYFSRLVTAQVPGSYSAPMLLQGTKPEDILQKYATKEVEVPVDILLEYRMIKLRSGIELSDDEINMAYSAGMKPEYLDEVLHNQGNDVVVFRLIEEGKLTGYVWEKCTNKQIYSKEILSALDNNYTLSDMMSAKSRGWDLDDMRREGRKHDLLHRIEERKDSQQLLITN